MNLNPEQQAAVKFCPKCQQTKILENFAKDRARKDGLNGWCKACLKVIRPKYQAMKSASERQRRAARRLKILQHYSQKEIPNCACCSEDVLEFLGVDHINGGGNRHRHQIGRDGRKGDLYRWIWKNNLPEGFRVLCHNCNQSLGAYGYCPHESK